MDRKAAARFARSSLVLASVCSAVRVAVVTQEDVVDMTSDATPTPAAAAVTATSSTSHAGAPPGDDNLSDATSDHGFLLVGDANVDWPEPQAEPGIAADVEQEQDGAAMTPPPPPGAVGADFFENNFAGYEDPFPLHYFTEPGPNGTGAAPAEAPASMEVDFDMHQEQSSASSASSTSPPVEDESPSPSRGGGSGTGPVPEEVEQGTSEEASSEDNNSRSDDVLFSEKQFSDAVNQAMQEAGGAEFAFRGSSGGSSSEVDDGAGEHAAYYGAGGGSSEAYHGMDWMEGNLGSSDEQNESATAGPTYTSAAGPGGNGILMADELGSSIAQRLAYPYGSASRGSF